MPAIIPADSNVTLEPPVTLPHFQSHPGSGLSIGLLPPYSIYITVAALAFFIVLRVAAPSLASSCQQTLHLAPGTAKSTPNSSNLDHTPRRSTSTNSVSAARECRKDYSRLVLARPSGSATGPGFGFTGGSAPSWNWNWHWTWKRSKNKPDPDPRAEGWPQRQTATLLGVGVGVGVGGPGHHQQQRQQEEEQGQALHHLGGQEQAIRLTGTGLADCNSSSMEQQKYQQQQRRSRGVSNRNNNAADLSQGRSSPAAGNNTRRSASSSSSSSSSPPHSRRTSSSDGAASGLFREQGTMDGDTWTATSPIALNEEPQHQIPFPSGINTVSAAGGAAAKGAMVAGGFDFTTPRQFMARPPPPPPLTPPTLSGAIFAIDDRRRSYPHSIPAKFDAVSPASSFIHQPNPDYVGASSSAAMKADAQPTTPRRRSYNKTLPIGIPISQLSPSSSSSPPTDVPSATTDGFSPSSFPPTSPLLPPPPPGHHELALDIADGHHQVGREIDVQGEIISVLDDNGAGWKRHTRVYGGGVCLACVAAGGGGGFYGDTVRPEDRR